MKKVVTYLLVASVLVMGAVAMFPRGIVPVAKAGDTSERITPESQAVQQNQDKLYNSVPLPQLDTSLERINIKKRLELWNNENKVSYIYLVNYGRVMAFYTVKGKVTSGSKRLTATDKIVQNNSYESGAYSVIGAPELDGTYGNSNPYIFFWTTDGVYVQWSGDYMLVDQPLQLTTQPELIRQIK